MANAVARFPGRHRSTDQVRKPGTTATTVPIRRDVDTDNGGTAPPPDLDAASRATQAANPPATRLLQDSEFCPSPCVHHPFNHNCDRLSHQVMIDFVNVDRVADTSEHGDGQTPTQVLPKLLQTRKQFLGVVERRVRD